MAVVKKCLGVDLGTNTIKVVELTYDKKNVKVTKTGIGEVGLELSATPEERRTAILKTLKDVLKKNKISTKDAVFSLPGQKVFIRRFRLPMTSPERLERVIAYEARQQVPFDISKTDFQYQVYEIPEDNEVEILLAAIRLDEIKSFMGMVNKTGLKPVAVAVSSFAVFNAQSFFDSPAELILEKLAGPKSKKEEEGDEGGKKEAKAEDKGKKKSGGIAEVFSKFTKKKKGGEEKPEDQDEQDSDNQDDENDMVFDDVKGFVNIGAGAMDLAIVTQNPKAAYLKFARSVPTAGNEITKSIMKACNVTSFLDAERIKKHQTQLMTFDYEEGADPNLNTDACAAATQSVDRILAELRKTLDFFISQADGMAVDKLVLSGGQANLTGLKDYIEEKLTVPVELRDEVPGELPIKWPENVETTDYIVSTGLALQGIGVSSVSVDFLPEEKKITRDFPWKMVAALAIMFIASMYFMSQAGQQYASNYQSAAEDMQRIIDRNRPLSNKFQKAQERRDQIATKYTEFAQTIPDRDYALDFLVKISNAKPANVVLNTLTLEHNGDVRIVGVSEFQAAAATFNNALKVQFEELKDEPQVNQSIAASGDQYGFSDIPTVYLFEITFRVGDKYNRMEITPTPNPELQNNNNQPGGLYGIPGAGGRPAGGRPAGGNTGGRSAGGVRPF